MGRIDIHIKKPKKEKTRDSCYTRYRKWSLKIYSRPDYKTKLLKLSLFTGALISIFMNTIPAFRSRTFWLYFIPSAGIIAALDAWGAAHYRGKIREAWIRALSILILFSFFTFLLWKLI